MARRKPQTDPGLFDEPDAPVEPGMTGDNKRDAMRRVADDIAKGRVKTIVSPDGVHVALTGEHAAFARGLLRRMNQNEEAAKTAK